MLPSGRYALLEAALSVRGVQLTTTAAAYRRAHELPGWYGVMSAVTSRSAWMPLTPGEPPGEDALAALVAPLGGGPGVVKDYVKSRKHEWEEACFVPDLGDTPALAAVVSRFVELQGEFLTGGVVVRAFEAFRPGEARVWWVDGRPVLMTPHPDMPTATVVPDLTELEPLVDRLGGAFVTTDVVQHQDGRWRLVEVGDGQVSGLPAGTDPAALVRLLLATGATGAG